MKQLLKIILFASLFLSCSLAQAKISCSHIQVCNLIDHQLARVENIQEKQTHLPLPTMGDPHHFEPSTAQIRELMTTAFLISAPIELHPWIGNIINHRNRNPKLKTWVMPLGPRWEEVYPGATLEALSHFWLYPQILCQIEEDLRKVLTTWGHELRPTRSCPHGVFSINEKKARQQLNNKTIVLTHDAMAPYLQQLGAKVITLRGSHHGERLSSQTLKDLHQELEKNKSVLWFFEEPLENSDQVLKQVRPLDQQIRVNTLGFAQEAPFDTLNRVLRELAKEH